ncbi:hypothetical protein L13192_00607 [Pyrenophora tritici-repentis]|uniref:Uncharacterized protein n=2 Tax=Pyrenophora tritici-repentis TaxID=45151 RepID=A0A922SZ07_9PLEO|nr:uncharacterized protein PTRG_01875 [Pyrenophora tritici-repentis Pt-1C-BFP]EDU41313.1 conserved hypothetical protein [Pyrenophora tritici-repentis Pt-1C-BFP]KAI1518129.1 hypothetical protein Ptr86124_003430 [Pyrenophora tritici-repentis]KAI1673860.1 hypothetical protein L13192_00607 [Pyrenophora tritici-repentis]KAI1689051.1 hypothetical protein KJE20_02229 [Pyrenophora tritici-repentis]
MKTSFIAITLIGAAAAAPFKTIAKREVPQEHAHENVLRAVQTSLELDNPDKITNTVFGLLGAKAAAEGAGNIKDTDCLQQAIADQAFTNAKAANDVEGMTMALVYRALERNTGSVGLASAACESIKAVNPEIAALQQHQDPASDGAAALNKQIATTLGEQIAAIGGDVTMANEASTFAPGEIGDPTGAGNTCDDADDAAGCINTLKLRVDDLSADELAAISAGGAAAAGAANNTADAAAKGANNKGNAEDAAAGDAAAAEDAGAQDAAAQCAADPAAANASNANAAAEAAAKAAQKADGANAGAKASADGISKLLASAGVSDADVAKALGLN